METHKIDLSVRIRFHSAAHVQFKCSSIIEGEILFKMYNENKLHL